MQSPKVRIILTLEATISPNGETVESLRERFARIATYAASDGLMTGDGSAEVISWDSWVVDREREITVAEEAAVSPDTLLEIQTLMDGVEWSATTLHDIAQVMVKAGYRVRDLEDKDL